MPRPYAALRAKMVERGIDQIYLAKITGLSQCRMSQRFTAKSPWKLDEMYKVMDFLNLPYEDMSFYFPKDGKSINITRKE